jgi:hydrogenase-4 membrane subunit HyfE
MAHEGGYSLHALVSLLEVLIVRAAIAPALLRRAILRRAEPNLDLMPSNLFAWAIAIALIVLAFQFGAPAMTDRQAFTLGAVGATVAVALLLLSTNNSPPAQLVAVLFMENALALFESLLPAPWPLPVHGALTAIYLATVGVGGWLIGVPAPVTAAAPAQEQP